MKNEKYKIGDRVEFFVNGAFSMKRKQGIILKIKGVLFKKYLIETSAYDYIQNSSFEANECLWIKSKNIYKKFKDN